MEYEEYNELIKRELVEAQKEGQPLGRFLGQHHTTIEIVDDVYEPEGLEGQLAMMVKFTGPVCAGCGSAGFTLSRSLLLFNAHLESRGIAPLDGISCETYKTGELISKDVAAQVLSDAAGAKAWEKVGGKNYS